MAKVVVYGTEYCPYCFRARQLLDSKNVNYTYIAVDNSPSLRSEMEQLSGRYTVPQIFIDDEPIGGCDDLYQLDANGKLDAMLRN